MSILRPLPTPQSQRCQNVNALLASALVVVCLLVPSLGWCYDSVRVDLDGLDRDLKKNVEAFLALDTVRERTAPVEVQRFLRSAPELIRDALRAFGHYRPVVDVSLADPDAQIATIRISVDPGPRVQIANVDVRVTGEGASLPEFERFLAALPVGAGMPLSHADYASLKRTLLTIAGDKGFVDARFETAELRVSVEQEKAWIDLVLATGSRYFFGDIGFTQDVLDPDVMRRFVRIEPGQPFDIEQLLALQRDLTTSGYFGNIRLESDMDHPKGYRIPVTVNVEPRKRFKYSLGAGYSTDRDLRGRLGIQDRRLNRRGHRWNGEVLGYRDYMKSRLGYNIPLQDPAFDALLFDLDVEQDDAVDDPAVLIRQTMAVEAAWRRRSRSGWVERFFVVLDHISEKQIDNDDPGKTVNVTNNLVIPGVTWRNSRADNPVFTTDGFRWRTTIRATDDTIGATQDISFLQIELSGKRVNSFLGKYRLLTRGDAGVLLMDDNLLDNLATKYQFFAGGDNSIRGYDYNSVVDTSDTRRGGRFLFAGSIEVDRQIASSRWRIAAFYDTGNAVENFRQFNTLKHGAGIGVRWNSPIGPLRLDLAFPLFDPAKEFRLHFTMGPDL